MPDSIVDPPRPGARRISRGPVVVLIGGATLIVSLVLLGAALAGAPVTAPQGTTPGTQTKPRDINVILRDYRFDPTPVYLFPGETVRLHVINGGMIQHELVLGDSSVQQAWATADEAATPPAPFASAPPSSVSPGVGGLRVVLGSGQSAELVYDVPVSGPLELVCHLPGHVERGMVGQVVMVNP